MPFCLTHAHARLRLVLHPHSAYVSNQRDQEPLQRGSPCAPLHPLIKPLLLQQGMPPARKGTENWCRSICHQGLTGASSLWPSSRQATTATTSTELRSTSPITPTTPATFFPAPHHRSPLAESCLHGDHPSGDPLLPVSLQMSCPTIRDALAAATAP
jgi:hypothetical protein